MTLHFDTALRLRSDFVKTPSPYGYAGVVVHRSASLASMYSFLDKQYYDHSSFRSNIRPGDPLTFLGSVRVEF